MDSIEPRAVPLLLRLPPELLDDVWQYIEPSDPSLRPVASSLIPFQRRILFSKVRKKTYQSLERLCFKAFESPTVVKQVQSISIEIEYAQGGDCGSSPHVDFEEIDPRTPSTNDLLNAFQSMPRIQSLSVFGSSRLAKAVIASPPSLFPSLDSLSIDTNRIGRYPFDPCSYQRVLRYSRLKEFSLHLRIDEPHDQYPRTLNPQYNAPSSLRRSHQLEAVTLHSRLTSDGFNAVLPLLRQFGPLSHLTLRDDAPFSKIKSLLRCLPAKHSLTSLYIGIILPVASDLEPFVFDAFVNLKSLVLDIEFTPVACELPTFVGLISVQQLVLRAYPIDCGGLEAFLLSSQRSNRLTKVVVRLGPAFRTESDENRRVLFEKKIGKLGGRCGLAVSVFPPTEFITPSPSEVGDSDSDSDSDLQELVWRRSPSSSRR